MSASRPSQFLQQERALMAQLLDVVRQEQRQLIGAGIDALADLSAHKTTLVGQLTALAEQRHAALAAAALPADEHGMAAWLAGDGEAAAEWQALLTDTREAKEINRLNGLLINKHMARTRSALNALHPQPSSQTYGRSGQASAAPTSRRLVIG